MLLFFYCGHQQRLLSEVLVKKNKVRFHSQAHNITRPLIQAHLTPPPQRSSPDCIRFWSGTWRSASRWKWSTATLTSSSAWPSTQTAACWPPAAKTRSCVWSSRAQGRSCRWGGGGGWFYVSVHVQRGHESFMFRRPLLWNWCNWGNCAGTETFCSQDTYRSYVCTEILSRLCSRLVCRWSSLFTLISLLSINVNATAYNDILSS